MDGQEEENVWDKYLVPGIENLEEYEVGALDNFFIEGTPRDIKKKFKVYKIRKYVDAVLHNYFI